MINMELWEKVIVEWINCLEVVKEPVQSTTELQDGVFYMSFLDLIKWRKHDKNCNQGDIIIKFLEDEYPSFKVNTDDSTEHIYIASLLLVHLCRTLFAIHESFQYNMCDNLKHETQIRVKTFLESVLPLGRDVTKETIKEVIMEVEDTSTTASGRRTPPHEDFSNSPAVSSPATRSGRSKKIMTERTREMRDLRCSLAVERFTNADLRDDVRIQHEKIHKLQRKLDEKSMKLKALQEERMKPNTPQPSRKQNTPEEDYYKKYINDLESQLNKQQDEMDKLEKENDTLSKKLSCVQRTSVHYKENFTNCERSLESLTSKIELKDRELVELRISNEELRAHVKELNKNSNTEQSFEVEDYFLPLATRRSLNTSEAMSSVIEIQLQEAKEESAILHAQVDSLKGKLDILTKNYRTAMESNRDLQEKVKTLDQLQVELNNSQKELDILNTDITNLQSEKTSLVAQNEDLKGLLSCKGKELSETEQSNATLNTELDNLKMDMKNLYKLLEEEKTNSSTLNISLTQTKSQITEYLAHIHKLTDERNSYESSIENYKKNCRDIFLCDNQFIQVEIDNFDNLTLNDLMKYLETMLHNYNTVCASYKCDIDKLKVTVDETSTYLLKQQLTITTLEEQNKQNLIELTNMDEIKKQMDLSLHEQKETIRKYSQEIEVLKEIRDEKHILEQNVCELRDNLIKKEQLLTSLMIYLEDFQDINKDLKLIKETTQQSFAEYQINVELTFGKLQHQCQILHHQLNKIREEKEELERHFNHTKNELLNIQAVNVTLQQNLLQNKETITNLEEDRRILRNELNEFKENVQKLKETNLALEEQYATMKTEANDNLECLTSENTKILHELKDATDKLNLLQQEMNDNMAQMELKNKALEDMKDEKHILEQNVHKLTNNLFNKEQLLKSLMTQLEDLQEINKDLKIMKETTQQSIAEYQENVELTFEKLQHQCQRVHYELHKMQQEKEKLEHNFNHSKNELLNTQTVNATLQQHLLEKQETINTLEEKERILYHELNESKQNVQKLNETIQVLEVQYATMKAEANDNLECLTSENTKISYELKDATDKLNLLQQEMNDNMTQMELKNKALEDMKDEKHILEQNVHKLTNNLFNKEQLLKSLMTQLEDLQDINKDLKLMKETTQRSIAEYQENVELTFDKIQNQCQILHYEFHKIQQEKEELEHNFNHSKKEFLNTQTINVTLQQSLLENKETITTLEEKERILCNELNKSKQNVQKLNETIQALEEQYTTTKIEANNNLESLTSENAKISLELKDATNNLNLLQQEMSDKMTQIELKNKALEDMRDEKDILQQNVHELINGLNNKERLLKSLMVQLEELQDINKDLESVKAETQRSFADYQENMELTCQILRHQCEAWHRCRDKMQEEKEELEHHFNHSKNELLNTQTVNATLKQNLLENKEVISVLEEKERTLCDELNESKRNVQELKETNRALEEQYATIKNEGNNNLESLKLENAKMSVELKNATEKFNLLQHEMNDTITQMEVKRMQINELVSNVSALKTEKKDLIHSHKKILEAKDKELGIKEEALIALQTKIDKLTNEASAMEKKMKEIIINLQEVRSSQDAVLATQEAALKEKCLHIEELQEQFNSSKETLNKELEDAKSSLHEYQLKFFDVQNQINDQNKTLAELQTMLKEMSAELETSKEYCKLMDASQAEIVKLCQELEYPTRSLNSTIIEACSSFDFLDQSSHNVSQFEFTYADNKTANILNIIKMTLDELYKSQKVISHLSCTNAELKETLAEQKTLVESNEKDKEEVHSLKTKVCELEVIAQKRNDYLKNLIKSKESLKNYLQNIFTSGNDLDVILTSLKQKWNEILTKFQDIFHIESPVCDEFKQLQIKKASLEDTLSKFEIGRLENIKTVSDILWENFLWTEKKLHDTYLCSVHEKECLDVLTSAEEDQFSEEKTTIDVQLENHEALRTDVMKSEEEIDSFTTLATLYENNLKSGKIKNQTEAEKKLQNQISQLTKEGKDLKNKMDSMRTRNVKLEKNIDDLRAEIKKLKSVETTAEGNLKEELERLKEQNQQLHEEKNELSKIAKQESENQLKEVHATYERKLEDVKQRMKTAYHEQMAKLSRDQEKIVREKVQSQTQAMCQKQRDELNRYKTHVGELSSQLWNVGEKLLIEQQQKQDALQRCKELQIKLSEAEANQATATISRKTCTIEKQEVLPENAQQAAKRVTTLIKEETVERRQSIRSIQTIGNAFKTEDEEEVFDNVYLADMKRGHCLPTTNVDRLSILQMRNSLCKPHLKSSYPAEMQFLPATLTEEEIKSGSTPEENFNDSLSQSLLPEQKAKKKDRSQTSYKKPGPPTPSKNGGRLSLQGNELRSPSARILRERNIDRRTTTTPHSLKSIFSLKRQDENVSTPKSRRLSSLFRKPRLQPDRSDR